MKKIKTLSLLTLPLVLAGTGAVVTSSLQNSNSEEAKVTRKIRSIGESVENGLKIKDFSAGEGHSGAIITDNFGNDSLYMWGNNDYNKLGIGSEITQTNIPTRINIAEEYKLKNLETSINHTGLIVEDSLGEDHLFMWGRNHKGQLGQGNIDTIEGVVEVSFEETIIKDIALGQEVSTVVTTNDDGKDLIYVWGTNNAGALGYPTASSYKDTPAPIPSDSYFVEYQEIKEIERGAYHAGLILTDIQGEDHLYMWGKNWSGQVGYDYNYAFSEVNYPLEVKDVFDGELSSLSLGENHSMIAVENSNGENKIYSWGNNSSGQLGNAVEGVFENVTTPTEILSVRNSKISLSSAGENSAAVITDSNGKDNLYMWGSNDMNQINISSEEKINYPYKVSLPINGEKDVHLGTDNSFVIVTDESNQQYLYAWGNNASGELGFGNNNVVNTPTENNILTNNSLSISTTLIEEISETEFIFEISIPEEVEFNVDDVEVYNSNGVTIGDTDLFVDEITRANSSYKFYLNITNTSAADNDYIYWSVDGGETLNLISNSKYDTGSSIITDIVTYSIIGIVSIILLILIISFIVFIVLKKSDKKRKDREEDRKEQDIINKRNDVLDSL